MHGSRSLETPPWSRALQSGAIKTCDLALENADQLFVPVEKSWRLNERMYGGLTGLDKKDTPQKFSTLSTDILANP